MINWPYGKSMSTRKPRVEFWAGFILFLFKLSPLFSCDQKDNKNILGGGAMYIPKQECFFTRTAASIFFYNVPL